MAKTLLLYGGQVVSPQLLWGCTEWHPEHGDSWMTDGDLEWVAAGGDLLLHQRPSPIAGGEQGFCWTLGCRQDPLQVSHLLPEMQNCVLLKMKWLSREVIWAHTQPPGISFKGLLLLMPHVRQVIMLFLLNALKQSKGFGLIQSDPFFSPVYWIVGFH